MSSREQLLSPSEAARHFGISPKALRVYEQQGLIKPVRTPAGWRTYGSAEMARLAEIAALRALGLSLAEVRQVLRGNPENLERALATHQAALEDRIHRLAENAERVRAVRAHLAQGKIPAIAELARLARPATEVEVAFDLPWPWGGERFELRDVKPLNYIIGPLFSGKTRLARAIAENLPHTAFIGLDRLTDGGTEAQKRLDEDPALTSRVDQILNWLLEEGATRSPALVTLIVALESEGPPNRVVDMVEQGLDRSAQEALIAHLRQRARYVPSPLFLLTRSTAILDLAAVGPDEAIICCTANHSPPIRVAPYPGSPGYEAVATCLASPEVRARTQGVTAVRLRQGCPA